MLLSKRPIMRLLPDIAAKTIVNIFSFSKDHDHDH